MKQSRTVLLLGILAFLIGCASDPEAAPEEEQPAEPAPSAEEAPAEEAPDVPVDLLAEAEELREVIIEYDLAQYANDRFVEGEERFEAGQTAYEDESFEEAQAELTFAVEAYEQVIDAGMPNLVGPAAEEASAARQTARDARAHVALSSAYQPVERTFNQAESARQNEEWVTALTSYREVTPRFGELAERAGQRRQEAEAAIERARQRLQQTEQRRQELESEVEDDLESAEELEEGGSQ